MSADLPGQLVEKGERIWRPWTHEAVTGTVESHGTAQTPSEGKEPLTRADLDEELVGENKDTGKTLPLKIKSSVCIK